MISVPPMIWVPNQLVGAPPGTDVTIECNTEAYPKAISYWVYDSNMILPTSKYSNEMKYRDRLKVKFKSEVRKVLENIRKRTYSG
ncbi:unnamed protein product, partial [Nesidiocoris tenuis]